MWMEYLKEIMVQRCFSIQPWPNGCHDSLFGAVWFPVSQGNPECFWFRAAMKTESQSLKSETHPGKLMGSG
jgi:hypothetical protein